MGVKTAREWFENADVQFTEAVHHVMVADTHRGREAIGDLDWTDFHRAMINLRVSAEQRHVAKHAALREAMMTGTHLFAIPVEGNLRFTRALLVAHDGRVFGPYVIDHGMLKTTADVDMGTIVTIRLQNEAGFFSDLTLPTPRRILKGNVFEIAVSEL